MTLPVVFDAIALWREKKSNAKMLQKVFRKPINYNSGSPKTALREIEGKSLIKHDCNGTRRQWTCNFNDLALKRFAVSDLIWRSSWLQCRSAIMSNEISVQQTFAFKQTALPASCPYIDAHVSRMMTTSHAIARWNIANTHIDLIRIP